MTGMYNILIQKCQSDYNIFLLVSILKIILIVFIENVSIKKKKILMN